MPRLCSTLLLSLLIASSASAMTMAWTPIGDPGNGCHPETDCNGYSICFGAVGYSEIGTYEVSIAQFCGSAVGTSTPGIEWAHDARRP